MTTKHTPTPWTLGQDGHLNYVINDTEGKAIAVTKSHVVQSSGLAFRNAAFIVRACNEYAGLVEACNRMRMALAYTEIDDPDISEALKLIIKALAKEKGES